MLMRRGRRRRSSCRYLVVVLFCLLCGFHQRRQSSCYSIIAAAEAFELLSVPAAVTASLSSSSLSLPRRRRRGGGGFGINHLLAEQQETQKLLGRHRRGQHCPTTNDSPSRHYTTTSTLLLASLRGGGGGNNAKGNKKKTLLTVEEQQQLALMSISRCFKTALAAGFIGTASVLWEKYQSAKLLDPSSSWSFLEMTNLSINVFYVVFGWGLSKAYKIFRDAAANQTNKPMDPIMYMTLTKLLSRLWMTCFVLFSLDGVALARSFQQKSLPIVQQAFFFPTAVFLYISNIPICRWFHHQQTTKGGQQPPQPVANDYVLARKMGLKVARNVLLVVGSIVVSALVDVSQTVATAMDAATKSQQGSSSSLLSTYGPALSSLSPIVENLIIGSLLASLYGGIWKAVLASTNSNFSPKDPSFVEYYQAQAKFYARVGKFFGTQAFFTVLGYIIAIGKSIIWTSTS